MRTSSVASLWAAASIAIAAPARAGNEAGQGTAAESLYAEGLRLFDAHDYAHACPKFQASLDLDVDNLSTRGQLAFCYAQAGKLASAWKLFRDVHARAQLANQPRVADVSQAQIDALAPRLAKVTFQIAATPGLIVKQGGVTVPKDAFGVGLATDAGRLQVTAEAPGYARWTREVTVVDGTATTIDIPALVALPPEPAGDAPATTDPRSTTIIAHAGFSTSRWVAVGLAGAAVISAGIGTWSGLAARSTRDDARALGCSRDLSSCSTDAALATANSAVSHGNLSTGFLIASGALLGGAAAVWFLAPGDEHRDATAWRVTPAVGPTVAGLSIGRGF